jgi:hypothetical protein
VRTSLAIALVAFSAVAGAQELGTLFHTPKEREALDRMRRGERVGETGQAYVRPDPVVTGYVKRSDGKSTVFLDKQPYPSRSERVQKLLEPQVIERFEPIPLPPPPPAPPGESEEPKRTAMPPAPSPRKPAAVPPKGGKEE